MRNKYHNSTLILPNNVYSILAAQAYARELAKKAGLDPTEGARVCLALEEAILNVAAHSFRTSGEEMYQIIFGITEHVFTIALRDNGLPFEEKKVAIEDMMSGDIDAYPDSGLGLHIMRNSVDHVVVKNFPGGKEVLLIKHLSNAVSDDQSRRAGDGQGS